MPSSSSRRTGASRSASCSWITRRWRSASPPSRRSPARWASRFSSSDRRVEQREPLRQVLLDRQLLLELRLQLELAGVVALLTRAGRDEGPEGAGLEAVDPVGGVPVAAVEPEGCSEQLAAESLLRQAVRRAVHAGDLILEIGIADDHPLEAERVALPVDLRAVVRGDVLQEL